MKSTGLILILLFLFMTHSIQGQTAHSLGDYFLNVQNSGGSIYELHGVGSINSVLISGTREVIEGSQYLNDQFVMGEISTADSGQFSGIPMRYNALIDEIEVKMPDEKIYYLAKNNQILHVKLNTTTMVFTPFDSSEGNKNGFLDLLYRGKSQLFQRNYKVFREGVPSNGILSAVPPKFVDIPKEFYIGLKDGIPQLCRSKKKLMEILDNHTTEIERFLKKEKINANHEDDLIKVLTWYDSL